MKKKKTPFLKENASGTLPKIGEHTLYIDALLKRSTRAVNNLKKLFHN